MKPRTRRILIVALLALALVLVLAPAALASAGGGSAGFGGGGGGGEGGGGGSGVGVFIIIQILLRIAVLGHGAGAVVLVALLLVYLFFTKLVPWMARSRGAQKSSGRQGRRQVARRVGRVEAAAAEAAEEDPAFAPETVKRQAKRLFTQIQTAWDADDRARLRSLVAPDLYAEWERRLDDFQRRGWRNRVKLLGEPTVEYVGLKNRGDASQDRVTVRVEARLRDYVEDSHGNRIKRSGHVSQIVNTREFWTLSKRNGGWILQSIEQGAEGSHALTDTVIPTPWSDDQAMHDEALVEGAVADAVPKGTKISEVADLDFDGTARAAAMDLSLADGRFAPDVLEVAARRAVDAWAEAVDGDDAALKSIAEPGAVWDLLHPGDPSGLTRVVVRGPVVKRIRIVGLDAASEPAKMSIEVDLQGRRYIEQRNTTAVVSGSRDRPTSFTEHWTLALTPDTAEPWRIVSVGAPVQRSERQRSGSAGLAHS
jgi:predicted lipid-binding transport protein (Tim44 family)